MEQKTLKELVNELGQYGISSSSLARICGINPGQMRHYMYGVKQPSQRTLDKINDGLSRFGNHILSWHIIHEEFYN